MLNPYLDTAIAVAVIYFVFSIMAYLVQEFWSVFRESRGRTLRKAVYDLLNDNLNKGYGTLLFTHPQFDFLKKNENKLPSYLPASNFASALIDLIGKEAVDLEFKQTQGKTTVERTLPVPTTNHDMFNLFKLGLDKMNNSNLKTLLQNVLAQSPGLEELKTNLENWYNEYMDRVTGWYKEKATRNLRWIGVALAVIFNVQAFYIISNIYSDRQLRDKLVSMGAGIVDQPGAYTDIYTSSYQGSLAQLNRECEQRMLTDTTEDARLITRKSCHSARLNLADSFAQKRKQQFTVLTDTLNLWNLPIGWNLLRQKGSAAEASGVNPPNRRNWWYWILGWLVSGLAISAGAPFWFQILNRFINIRRTGIRPSSTAKSNKQN